MKITFIGHGYVGLVSATIFADLGNTVYVIGHTKEKIDNLKKGIIPIYEPGLEEMVKRNVDQGRLIFTLDYSPAISDSEIVFIAVGTPPKENGEADLSTVLSVTEKLAKHIRNHIIVATKSTVPVGTNKIIKSLIKKSNPDADFDVASVPEFLREGSAIEDTLRPDRIIIGTENQRTRDLLLELHKPIKGERVICNLEAAELIKYASNSFLATKISFSNAIAKLSELSGANAEQVLYGMGLDKRIGDQFLNPGVGYGGSCFPKDVDALISISKGLGYDFRLLKEVKSINKDARDQIISKVKKLLGQISGKKIGVLGLAFKPNTDDMRDAPAVDIINSLIKFGAKVKAYDPEAMKVAKGILPNIEYSENSYDAIKGVDLLIILTEWNEFKELDFAKIKNLMTKPLIVDGRNIYDPEKMKSLGFTYISVGR